MMNREIKFRAFSESGGMLDCNSAIGNVTHLHWNSYRVSEYNSDGKQVDLPLMQYTGLKDRNGIEIYEGDALCLDDSIYFVEWNVNGSWSYRRASDRSFFRIEYWKTEVIGNIHENPELLEQSK